MTDRQNGRISDVKWLRIGRPAVVHHTAERPSAYGAFSRGGEGWLVVDRASRCLVSVHGPYATSAEARAEVRRLEAQAEARRSRVKGLSSPLRRHRITEDRPVKS